MTIKKQDKNQMKSVANFLFEMGILKRIKRNGCQHLGSNLGTIAEHSFRCAIIGYSLAKMENLDENKVLKMCLFHDIAETRIGDLNAINKQYIKDKKKSEEKAIKDQCENLSFGNKIIELFQKFEEKKTKEAILAKDADILEQLISVKEIYDTGNPQALDWIEFSKKSLKTKIAKQLAEQIIKSNKRDWWYNQIVK